DDLQYDEVMQEQGRSGKTISQILQDFELVDLDTQLQVMAEHLSTEVVSVSDLDFTPELLKSIPAGTARMYQAIPVANNGSCLQVALADPLNPATIDDLAYIVGKEIQLVIGDPGAIEKLISRYYGEDTESVSDILKELGADTDIAKESTEAELDFLAHDIG